MILIIYRSQVCREIVLPNADNTDYRIFIDSKEFKLKKSFYLSLEVIAHKWSITNENGEYKIVKNQSEFEKTSLGGGDIVSIITPEKDSLRCIVVDAEPVLASFEKYFIGNGLVTVGSEADNTVQCSFLNLISKHHCNLRFDGINTVLEDILHCIIREIQHHIEYRSKSQSDHDIYQHTQECHAVHHNNLIISLQ